MSASPTSATGPSQKRPLEEPSSPGSGEQPEAKRPALDKAINSDEDGTASATPALPTDAEETTSAAEPNPQEEKPRENGTTDHQGDTILPDAPASATQPIQSTSNLASRATPAAAPAAQDESDWMHVRAVISSAEAATIIGKGGENVTLIRNKSGAKCTVSEYSRGAVERILTVSGPVDAIAKAFGLIIRTLNQEDLEAASSTQSKTYPLRLLVPHILIGSIIGKGGARIKEIQQKSSARLNASDSCLPLSTERSLVVLGVADAVHIATYYICDTLKDQLTERFGGPAASAYATRSGHPTGAVPGGMQVVPYVPQNAGGQWGHPDHFRRHTNTPQRTPANPYGIPYLHGQPPQPQAAPAPIHYGGPQRPYQGAGPQQPQPYPAQPGPSGHPVPQQQMGVAMQGQPITQQIYIPNDMVGAIIGKGGAKINEIRQLSGSVIKINEPQDNSNERLVTITGTQECNQMALYMLYSRLESEKHRI